MGRPNYPTVVAAVAVNAGNAAGESTSVNLGGEVLSPLALDLATVGGVTTVTAREVLNWVLAAVSFARRRDRELRRRAGELALEAPDLALEVHVIVAHGALLFLAHIHTPVLVLDLGVLVPKRGPKISDLGLEPVDLVVLLEQLEPLGVAVRVGPGAGALSVVVRAGFGVVVRATADGAVVVVLPYWESESLS